MIETPAPAPIVVVDPAADFRIALDHRPDYQQARLIIKRSSINARQQLNQLLPRVDLVGSYGYNGLDASRSASRRMVQDKDYRSYSWGVVASVVEDIHDTDEMVEVSTRAIAAEELCEPGDRFIITAGVPFGMRGTTNLIRVERFRGPQG